MVALVHRHTEKQGLDWKSVDWIPNRVVVVDDMAPITVPPKQEFRIAINLLDLVELLPGQSYQVRFEAKGWAEANHVGISIKEPSPQGSPSSAKQAMPTHN